MSEPSKDHRMEDILLHEQNLLDGDQRRELEEHMPGCAECQATLVKVTKYLPILKQALQPQELPAEELLRQVKAQLRARKEKPAPFYMRPRIALTGFALAGAAAAAIAVEALLPSLEPAMMAKGEDAGARSGYVAAPRRSGYVAAPRRPEGPSPDAGADGGAASGGEDK